MSNNDNTEHIDLKTLEKKAWRSTFQDGIWDIYLGLILIGMGLGTLESIFNLPSPITSLIIIFVWDMIAVFILIFGKKKITIPRMGFVKFGKKRKVVRKRLLVFLSTNALILLLFVIFTPLGIFDLLPFEGLAIPIFIGITFITLPLSVIAYFLEFNRLFFYALVSGFSFFLTELLNQLVGAPLDAILPFTFIGSLVLVIGFVYLRRFLKTYPLLKEAPETEIADG